MKKLQMKSEIIELIFVGALSWLFGCCCRVASGSFWIGIAAIFVAFAVLFFGLKYVEIMFSDKKRTKEVMLTPSPP